MAQTLINVDSFLAELKQRMNEEMLRAAEPAIKKAVEEAEREIRVRLGAMVVSLLDRSFMVERRAEQLVIVVEHRNLRNG